MKKVSANMKKYSKRKIFTLCAIFLTFALIGYLVWGNLAIQVTEYSVSSDRLPKSFSGFRIAQVSDLHNAEFGQNNQRLLDKLRAAEPDIIVLTGDLIDSRRTDLEVSLTFAKNAVKIAPTYYIPGNHEARISGLDEFYDVLQNAGVDLLLDESIIFQIGTEEIQLSGIIDPMFRIGNSEKLTNEAIQSFTESDGMYSILLSHRPEYFDAYAASNADLVLTGHAHGGQFRLPFVGGLYAPEQGFFPKYDAGLFFQNGTTMIVSRGLGNSLFPVRFNNAPELVLVTLQCDK